MKALATVVLATLVAAAAAGPAAAKPTRYAGKTSAGDGITFSLSGGGVTRVRAATPTTCVPTEGTPRAGTDLFQPPGRFRLGRTTKRQTPGPVDTAMHYSEVTKWFHVTVNRRKRGTITGTLHQNFSFQTLSFDFLGNARLLPWVCQGDAHFSVRPR